MSRSLVKLILPIVVLLLGAGATAALLKSRKPAQRSPTPKVGPLVEVQGVHARSLDVHVHGQGEIRPAVEVELQSQVTGLVKWVSPALTAGGRFEAGQTLLRIDPRDFELAVERAQAAVARADVAMEREQAEADVAAQEWRQIEGDTQAPALLLRKPQIRQAEAELAAAKADLESAKLSLSRTRLSLPFDGIVISESVDPGQLISLGRTVATAYGTAMVELRLPLDDAELEGFELPTSAVVHAQVAGERYSWPARAARLEGLVDSRSRMVHVVLEVPHPFDGGALQAAARPPLLPGTFAEAEIAGRTLEQVIPVPRYALREGDVVWTVDDQQRLHLRPVEVERRERHEVFISGGLESGERIVTSSLDAVTNGMEVRVADTDSSNLMLDGSSDDSAPSRALPSQDSDSGSSSHAADPEVHSPS